MIIDTHAHLNFSSFNEDREKVIKRTIEKQMKIINVGSNLYNSKKAISLAENYDNLYAAVGLHPIHLETGLIKIKNAGEETKIKAREEFFKREDYFKLTKNKKVVAIGEAGLDFWYKPKSKTKKEKFKQKQKECFLKQVNLALDVDLPMIIHCRLAHNEMIELLNNDKKPKGVIHCFTGSKKQMELYLNMGFYLGFNGIIFKLNLDDIIKKAPMERMLVETDCPYLTPPAFNDKRNEPIFISEVIKKIAEVRNVSEKEIEEATTKNAQNLFNL